MSPFNCPSCFAETDGLDTLTVTFIRIRMSTHESFNYTRLVKKYGTLLPPYLLSAFETRPVE